jgi:hypothetical protein
MLASVPYPGFEADATKATPAAIQSVLDNLDEAERARDETQIVKALSKMETMSAILRVPGGLPNRQSSILRTHREQSLQTNCKPPPVPRRQEKENLMPNNVIGGAPESR